MAFLYLAAALILGYLGIGYYFYRFAVARTKKSFLSDDPALPKRAPNPDLDEWWESAPSRDARVAAGDLSLYARVLPAPSPTPVVAILIHGYSGTGAMMRSYARLFRTLFSCHLIVPDLRGHGKSDGSYIGFGWREREDLRLWIDWALENIDPDARIVLFGVSMGGASVCSVLGDELPSNVRAAVSDCAFSTARGALAFKLKSLFGLPAFPALPAAELVTRVLAGYRLRDASPADALRRARVPLLIVHGEADTFVPVSMARELHAAAGCPTELWTVPEAGHADSFRTAPEAYASRLESFLRPLLTRPPV